MDALSRWTVTLWIAATAGAWLITDHFPPWTSFHSEAIAVIAGAALVLHALLRGAPRIGAVPALLLAWGFVPLAQWGLGQIVFFGDALLACGYLWGSALCWWAGGAMPPHDRQRYFNAFIGVFLVLGLLGTGIAAYQLLELEFLGMWATRLDPSGRATGNVAQSNHLAAMLCFAVAAVAVLRARQTIGAPVAALAAGFLLCGIALTQSRMPWVAGLVLGAWMLARREALMRPLRLSLPGMLGIGLWYVLAFSLAQRAQMAVVRLQLPEFEPQRLSGGTRPTIWAQWIQALGEAPWTGLGWLQGNAAQLLGSPAHPGYEYLGGYGHNVVLDLLAWNGLPLGALFVAVFAVWYFRAGQRASGADAWFRLAIVTTFGVHAMLEHPHSYTYFLVPVAMLAGQIDADRDALTRRCTGLKIPLTLATAAVLTLAVLVVRDYFIIETDTRELRAQHLNIGGRRTSQPPQGVLVLDQLLGSATAGRVVVRPGMPDDELALLERMALRFPTRYFLQQTAKALALHGRDAEAERYIRWIASIHGRAGLLGVLAVLEANEAEEPMGLGPKIEAWKKLVPPAK